MCEQQVMADCHEAFRAVQQFESSHGLTLNNMGPGYVAQRPSLVSRLLEVSHKLGVRDEVVHDAVQLMDRAASQAKQVRAQAPGQVCVRGPHPSSATMQHGCLMKLRSTRALGFTHHAFLIPRPF